MAEKNLYFDGKRFTRDERTGYYLCSTLSTDGKRKRMHVYVWEYYNGPIPVGYHVHHINGDKSDNDISNLELLSEFEHLSLHGKEKFEKNYQRVINNLRENAAPKAKEWHASKEGHEWHIKHYNSTKDKLHAERNFICTYCGKEFTSTQIRSQYCSNNCKSAARRKSGVDNILKICIDCGEEYIANKYQKTKYCPVCKSKKHTRNRKS